MKLVSSTPPPQRHHQRNGSRNGAFRRRLLGRLFSARTAYWLMAVIVTVFAITIFRMFRHLVETMAQP